MALANDMTMINILFQSRCPKKKHKKILGFFFLKLNIQN
jgi:hypothetical protein